MISLKSLLNPHRARDFPKPEMLDMPPAFCHPLPDEIVIGTIYGMVALLAVIRSDDFSWRAVGSMGVIVLSGHWALRVCEPLVANGQMAPLNQLFVLGLLAAACRFAAELNRRFDQWNQTTQNPSPTQFSIGGLLWLTTCFAIAMLLVKQTTLTDRSAIYWVGLFVFLVMFSLAFSRHCVVLLGIAGMLAVGFALIDARGIQPGDLEFRSALIRYSGLLFGMILPRLVFNEFLMGLLSKFIDSNSATDEPTTLTQECDDVRAHEQWKAPPSTDLENAAVGPTIAGVAPTDEAGPAFRVVC